MTTTLESVTKYSLHGSVLGCAPGALFHHFYNVVGDKPVPKHADTSAEAKRLFENPAEFVHVLAWCLEPTRIGGKHGNLLNVDEGYPRIGECVARMAIAHGGTIGDGTGKNTLNSLCGRVFRYLRTFVVQSKRFPTLSGPRLFLNPVGVADTYAHAYTGQVFTFDDMAESWASMLAWFAKFFDATKNPADRDWCLEQLRFYVNLIRELCIRYGGVPQFVCAETLYMRPGREFEPGAVERRATINAAHSLLIAASMGINPDINESYAESILDTWWIDNPRVVWWDGEPVGHYKLTDQPYAIAHGWAMFIQPATFNPDGIGKDLEAARRALKGLVP